MVGWLVGVIISWLVMLEMVVRIGQYIIMMMVVEETNAAVEIVEETNAAVAIVDCCGGNGGGNSRGYECGASNS